MAEAREETLTHLRLVASLPGFWELRALQRLDGNRMEARGSFFLIVAQAGESLIFDRIEQACDWADYHARNGCELFLGVNPREREGRGQDAIERLTACYVDLDLPDGVERGEALEQLETGEVPLPSYVVNSGYGLHAVWLLHTPASDKLAWKRVQKGLVRHYAELGADPKVAPDESRVLRLVPYPNRKLWPEGVPTGIVYQSENRYRLEELAEAIGPLAETPFSAREVLAFPLQPVTDMPGDSTEAAQPPAPTEMEALIDLAERSRTLLEQWIRRNMQPGLHYGIIPLPDGQAPSKPTLLKPGAELVAQLYQWRIHFTADLDSLQMYGPAAGGTFAYICHVIDQEGRTVGQGRGVAELRERDMLNANKSVKMAEKRAMVDAILRCAALSQWFTQDLEEPPFDARPVPRGGTSGGAERCVPTQVNAMRLWLHRTRKTEAEILKHYKIGTLEELTRETADRVLARLMEIGQQTPRTAG
jgi:hypothetical protein